MIKSYMLTGLFAILFWLNGSTQTTIFSDNSKVENVQSKIKFTQEEVVEQKVFRRVQFSKIPNQMGHNEINSRSITLLTYIGNRTYIASIPNNLTYNDLSKLGIITVDKIQEDDRANFEIRNNIIPEWAVDGAEILLSIEYPEGLDQKAVISWLAEHNIQVEKSNGFNNILEVRLRRSSLKELTQLPYILNVEAISPPAKPEDKAGRNLHRVNRINSTTGAIRDYTGRNINMVVRDDGAVFDHIDFKGRMDQSFSGISRGDHGDGVAGLMVGSGNLDPLFQGMAYGSDFYVIDYTAGFLDETMSLHTQNNVLITNSSYSNGCNAGYTNTTRTVDQQMFNNPTLLHVFSAGNNGEGIFNDDTGELEECGYGAGLTWGNVTGGHKIGKNVIAVANMNATGSVVSSSSRGPAFDGRIKPDIAANGFNHFSTVEAQDYEAFGGTSAAAPVVAGISAMLYEAYEVNHGQLPDAALIKAIILNTANDAGNKGPDFINGWGTINAHRAALAIEEGRFLKGTIDQDIIRTHQIEIPDNVIQARIMTYWADRDGRVSPTQHLINNINTSVTDGNTLFLPWVLDHTPDPALLAKPATKGIDAKNNMEQVAIDNPASGMYTLEINGAEIPFGEMEYYVVWEFRTSEIDVTYPNGGENVEKLARETIHWDAEGDQGEFLIEVVNDNGEVLASETSSGDRRLRSVLMPGDYNDNLKIRVSRDGISDESDESFIVSDLVAGLKTEGVDGEIILSFEGVEEAVNYNIYALGDKYMEKVAIADSTSFIIPDMEIFKLNWVAVSANFEGGKEGLRSRAIPVRPAPVASVLNDKDDEPCVNEIVTFSTNSLDTLTEYEWTFGDDAIPQMAFSAGPHLVRYTRKGSKVGFLKVSHEGGSDNELFFVDVKSLPSLSNITSDETDEGVFAFSSNASNVDNYLWDFGDGNSSTDKSPVHTYLEDGLFTVQLTADGPCGEVFLEKEVIVNLSTSTNEQLLESIVIHPNPSFGQFQINVPTEIAQDGRIEVWTMDGKLVLTKPIAGKNTTTVDVVSSGVYQVHIIGSGMKAIKKIVIQ